MRDFRQTLDRLGQRGRYRTLMLPAGIDLTSNDYLGLASSVYLRECALKFLQNGGVIGAGGSRLLRGHTDAHAALEDFAAGYFSAPKSLYFATGFQANSALFQTLCTRHDTIIFDEFVHASAREGIQNSNAQHIKAVHNDVNSFEEALRKAKAQQKKDGQIWVAVESVYSMDGDIAPLKALYGLAEDYDAVLVVDEAHATGVMGRAGKGLAYELYSSLRAQRSNPEKIDCFVADTPRNDVWPDNLIVLHTCGKAIGVAGGLVCGSEAIIDFMINAARGFIYSTAPLPLQVHLVQKSLEWIASEEGEIARKKLAGLSRKAQQSFGGPGTHIVPIMLGDDAYALDVAQKLQQKGYDIRAIRPPTVPEGTARLRLSLSAALDKVRLDQFAADLDGFLERKAA